MSDIGLEERLARLEAVTAISRLQSDYCLWCDTPNLDRLASLFATDSALSIPQFDVHAVGRPEIRAAYQAQTEILEQSHHWTHDVSIDVHDADRATGLITARAEVVIGGVAYAAAMHYVDRYSRVSGSWLMQSRIIHFRYYAPLLELDERMASGRGVRTAAGFVSGYKPPCGTDD